MGKIVIFHTFGALKILKILIHHKVDMKKIILSVAIAGLAISCQKIQAGGNKGVLKMEHGVERYSDDVMSDEATAKVDAMQAAKTMKSTDSSKTVAQPTMEVKTDSAKAMNTAPAAAATETK